MLPLAVDVTTINEIGEHKRGCIEEALPYVFAVSGLLGARHAMSEILDHIGNNPCDRCPGHRTVLSKDHSHRIVIENGRLHTSDHGLVGHLLAEMPNSSTSSRGLLEIFQYDRTGRIAIKNASKAPDKMVASSSAGVDKRPGNRLLRTLEYNPGETTSSRINGKNKT